MNQLASTRGRGQHGYGLVGALLFALALFGYPIVGTLNSLLGIEDRFLSVAFRMLVAVVSLFIFAALGRWRIRYWHLPILLIWCALVFRLSFDILVAHIEGVDYALQLFIVGSVLPVLALWKLGAYDQMRFAVAGFTAACIGSLSSLFANYLGAFGEADLTEVTGRLSSVSLNAVSLGHLAVSGIFCGLVLWRQVVPWKRIPIAMAMAGMLLVMVQTGSKGPVAALAVALLLWSARRGRGGRLIALAIPVIVTLALYGDSPIADRMMAVNEDPSTHERIVLIQDSLQQIASSPWFGSASVELNTGYYPHNILLEAAMSFGIPLTTILVAVLVRGWIVSWRLLNTDGDLVALLFIQALVISQLSGALFADSLMWFCLMAVIALDSGVRRVRRRKMQRPPRTSSGPEATAT